MLGECGSSMDSRLLQAASGAPEGRAEGAGMMGAGRESYLSPGSRHAGLIKVGREVVGQ